MVQPRRRPVRVPYSTEVARLRELLANAEATLSAIQVGEVDALVVDSRQGPKVYTLVSAEFDYRRLIESMNEGALVLKRDGAILYANTYLARLLGRPLAQMVGGSLYPLLSAADRPRVARLLKRRARTSSTTEVLLQCEGGVPLPACVSLFPLHDGSSPNLSVGMVVSDLSDVRRREEFLRHFARSLMRMQELERQQVATEFGENVNQLLCALLLRGELLAKRLPLDTHGVRAEILALVAELRSTTHDVQRVATNLQPHLLATLGLLPALESAVAEFATRSGVRIELNGDAPSPRPPAASELALYRVLQEALSNVEHHARAKLVIVTLRCRNSVLLLKIKDDGIGFDPLEQQSTALQQSKFGVLSMRERVAAAGGTLQVISGAGRGTEVRCSMPLSPS